MTAKAFTSLVLASVALLPNPLPTKAADGAAKASRPEIYDRKADGAKQIESALATARAENKRVLLQFGANWCGWCHKLHHLFQTNRQIAQILREGFVVVLIDVDQVDGKRHNAHIDSRYGNPTRHGLPVLVVLDADGKQITTQDTGKLEDGPRHDPAKVIAFLEKWKLAKGIP